MANPKYGLEMWNDRTDAEFDIVFVHGLRGSRKDTWTKNGVFWPEELLIKDLEKCRMISFGYDSGVMHSDTAEITQGSLESDARYLCSLLTSERSKDGTEARPIITVAHSLGGLVCAQTIVSGEKVKEDESISKIAMSIKGMIFLGTPFGGSGGAVWADLARKIFNLVKKTDQKTLKTLKPDSDDLKSLRTEFPNIVSKRREKPEKIGVVFFYERFATYGVEIVAETAASYPGVGEILPMRTNHIDICKFETADDDGYKVVKSKIVELMQGNTKIQEQAFGIKYEMNVYGGNNQNVVSGTQNITNQTTHYGSNGS
ncbi:Alpha/Beta hydrolase protein [Halenospora varia]|nr:Alpha/Beta hydrolase protein [Halenospora varia]